MRLATFLTLCLAVVACSRADSSSVANSTAGSGAAEAEAPTGDPEPSDDASTDDTATGDDDAPENAPAACQTGERVVTFETSDGVTLTADLLVPEGARGTLVMIHMIPPAWDRTSFPPRVREAFAALGYVVLNVDRRGAGDSGGVAEEAYEGDGGRLDIEAAVRHLQSLPESCGADLQRLALIGASNGTTSVLDYLIARDEALPAPIAAAWLSPGAYTENQHLIADVRDALDPVRLFIAYPTSEPWATQFLNPQPASWELLEVTDGQHGTRNFDDGALEAQLLPALTAFLRI